MCCVRTWAVLGLLCLSIVTASIHIGAELSNSRLIQKRSPVEQQIDSYLNSNSGDYSSYSDRDRYERFGRNGGMGRPGDYTGMPGWGREGYGGATYNVGMRTDLGRTGGWSGKR